MLKVDFFLVGVILLFGLMSSVSAIEETVACVFVDSDEEHTCFATYGVESFWFGNEVIRFSCTGVGECFVNINFDDEIINKYNLKPSDLDIYWQNMDGCYGSEKSIIDGVNQDVTFYCSPPNISEGFLYAFWTCDDGKSGEGGDGNICKSKREWRNKAEEFCNEIEEVCVNEDCTSKIGRIIEKTKSVEYSQDCWRESQGEIDEVVYSAETGEPIETPNEEGVCESGGCGYPFGSRCYPSKSVVNYHYCTEDGSFVEQLDNGKSCEENFQCVSDFCSSGMCEKPGFFQRLFRLIF